MGGRKRGPVPAELERARSRFDAWRRTRKPKSRIPEPLWALAVKLVSAHGLHRTAATLKLDYYSLQKRVATAAGRTAASRPTFIELPTAVATARECVLEFEEDDGARLRVHLTGYDAADIVAVGCRLWKGP
jgi:hypothetical protein